MLIELVEKDDDYIDVNLPSLKLLSEICREFDLTGMHSSLSPPLQLTVPSSDETVDAARTALKSFERPPTVDGENDTRAYAAWIPLLADMAKKGDFECLAAAFRIVLKFVACPVHFP